MTPIVSISIGQSAKFRLGGAARSDPTQSVQLDSGDVIVLAGKSRQFFHGIDRLIPDDLLSQNETAVNGRLNLTLRRVTRSETP